MVIKDNIIYIHGVPVNLGDSFGTVRDSLGDFIYTLKEPRENGLGHIILEGVGFYELNGSATLYFNRTGLKKIELAPDWKYYDLKDDKGDPLPYDTAINLIAGKNRGSMREGIGAADYSGGRELLIFLRGDLKITSAISRDGTDYSISITSFAAELNTDPLPVGYAFASTAVLELNDGPMSGKVGYAYREAPDSEEDTGWRFFRGDETPEYLDNPDNVAIVNISTICANDPSVKLIIRSGLNSAFERSDRERPFTVVK